MTAPWFAVTGTGRSGTKYLRNVLRASGFVAGHEEWFNPVQKRREDLDVDVSWLAPPFIEKGEWDGYVVHVTRHPVDCVRALVGSYFLTTPGSLYTDFALYHTSLPPDPVYQAVEWWAQWNERICRLAPVVTFQIERLPTFLFGRRLAVEGIPTDVHHGGRADIPAADIWDLLEGRAGPYGYAP